MAGKNRKYKEKHGHRMPPLSPLDRCIYFISFSLMVVIFLMLLFLPMEIFRNIMFSDPNIIAAVDRGELMRWSFFFYVLLSAFIFVVTCYEGKKPIFGNQRIKYGDHRWKSVYPLFSKERREYRRNEKPSDIRFRRKMWTAWLIGLGFTFLFLSLSIFCRWTYEEDGRFHKFNSFNTETVSCPVEELTELTFNIHKNRKSASYSLRVFFELEGGRGRFYMGDFSGDTFEERLEQLLALKEAVPQDRIFYTGKSLERYLHYEDPTPSERDLLNQIFQMNEGSGEVP